MNELITGLLPAVTSFGVVVGTLILGFLSTKLSAKYKVQIEEGKKVIEKIDRDALHKALETAASLVKGKGLLGEMAVDFMIDYVFKSTPDAIRNLKPSSAVLQELAKSKLEKVQEAAVEQIAIGSGISPERLRQAIEAVKISRR